jgi:outer membrane protein assembly factor BamD (BamD/ComL family)
MRHAIFFLLFWALSPAIVCAQAEQEIAYDPYKAEKSLEVGRFYLKKKNYDAAIGRTG